MELVRLKGQQWLFLLKLKTVNKPLTTHIAWRSTSETIFGGLDKEESLPQVFIAPNEKSIEIGSPRVSVGASLESANHGRRFRASWRSSDVVVDVVVGFVDDVVVVVDVVIVVVVDVVVVHFSAFSANFHPRHKNKIPFSRSIRFLLAKRFLRRIAKNNDAADFSLVWEIGRQPKMHF